ncbi:TPA: hypothetical protein EYP66_06015, partial [Candidatus Poribacteria bacterium]|nr:hypothetical protein [Candidatus Poribacteria bacterium]
MKKSFLLLLLISLFWSSTVHAELTKKDLEGMEARLDLKISVLQKEIQGEIKALDTKLEERFGAVDKRFETINAKFEAINTRFDAINA